MCKYRSQIKWSMTMFNIPVSRHRSRNPCTCNHHCSCPWRRQLHPDTTVWTAARRHRLHLCFPHHRQHCTWDSLEEERYENLTTSAKYARLHLNDWSMLWLTQLPLAKTEILYRQAYAVLNVLDTTLKLYRWNKQANFILQQMIIIVMWWWWWRWW